MTKKYPVQIKQFGKRIKELRIENNLTQEELGSKGGLSKRTILRIEAGEFAAGLNVVFALAQTFKMNPHELLLHIDLPVGKPSKAKK